MPFRMEAFQFLRAWNLVTDRQETPEVKQQRPPFYFEPLRDSKDYWNKVRASAQPEALLR